MQVPLSNAGLKRSIFPLCIELSEDDVYQKIKHLLQAMAAAEPNPPLMELANKGEHAIIQDIFKYKTDVDPNIVNTCGATPLFGALGGCCFESAYLTAKVLIAAGADVNACVPYQESTIDLEATDPLVASLYTPLTAATEGAWERSASIIQLLILHGGVIYSPLSFKGQERVEHAMQQLFDQQKLLYVALLDNKCAFSTLLPELMRLIIKASTFACHEFIDDPKQVATLKPSSRKMCCIS